MVENRSLFNFLESIKTKYFGVRLLKNECEGILFSSNYIFDFSLEQILLSLVCGNRLLIPQQQHSFESTEFYTFANKNKLTYISGTPTQVHRIDFTKLRHVHTIVVAGEPFLEYHFRKLQGTYTGSLYSAYGTTETTVYNTVAEFDLKSTYRNNLGTPLKNTLVYILDSDLKKLPDGAVGEICISGDCVARGYLNQPILTGKKFLKNPYQLETNDENKVFSKIYRTGDLVRKRIDGSIEYLGRNDSQVKVNGIRIELSEVESVIAEYPEVIQSAAILHSEKYNTKTRDYIVGYFVTENNVEKDQGNFLGFLRKKLPAGMVPSRLLQVRDSLPLTPNGKLDKRTLATLVIKQEPSKYTPPRNRIDAILCALWREELGNHNIGIDDNFFRAGGDSIRAMMLASKIQQKLNTSISVKDVFDHPSIKDFVDNILGNIYQKQHLQGSSIRNSGDEILTGECSLLPIQKWFFAKNLSSPHHWNQYFSIRTPKLDVAKLYNALNALVKYHDAFRLRYVCLRENDITQFYSEDAGELSLHMLDASNISEEDVHIKIEELQTSFNLEKGPTWCVIYTRGYSDGSARICFAMHHLIVDTVSWQIIARDLEILYNGGELGSKSFSYKQWAQAIQDYTPSVEEKKYWNQISLEVLNYNKRTHIQSFGHQTNVHHEKFCLNTDDTRALLTECQWAYDTQINDLLLTAVGLSLKSINGQEVNYVTLEGHGRNTFESTSEVRDTVGWFTVMYPYKLELQRDIGQSVLSIKNCRLQIPHGGIGYGAIKGNYGGENAPLPFISFNYLGQFSDNGDVSKGPGQDVWKLDHTLFGTSKGKDNEVSNACDIDITTFCQNGRMFISVEGSWEESEVKKLARELESALSQIIEHTKKKKYEIFYNKSTIIPYLNRDFEPYIVINGDKAEKTLFVFPPGEGGAESYLSNIAKHIKDQRLILFNNIHLHQPMGSFEDIAKYYIDYITGIQPEGPYDFLGWSFGGVLALEVALQLVKRNYKINNLLMIDSYFDVRFASESIGLPNIDNILDPINYYYSPDPNDLKKLTQNLGKVVMFKAARLNDVIQNVYQKPLFDFYMRSPYNNLDRLIPCERISIVVLMEDTHHSWVRNERQVLEMSTLISESLDLQNVTEFPK